MLSYSKFFIKIEVRATGLKSFKVLELLHFGTGTTTASFQIFGTCCVCRDL